MKGNKEDRACLLDSIRVVECGVFHAGPGAAAILGELGAEVIKVETLSGDPERTWYGLGHINLKAPDSNSMMFEVSNPNKKSICLDIEHAQGRQVFEELIRTADVFITNLRQSTRTRLKIDWPSLARIRPELIYAGISGFGPKGPLSDAGAFDPMAQARSGMMFATGNGEPLVMQLAVLDQAAAISASQAILGALFYRERFGTGQEVHVSLYGTALWLMQSNVTIRGMFSLDPAVLWARENNSPLRNSFLCKDGNWIMGTHHPEERYWKPFCEATGQSRLLDDSRFSDEAGRQQRYPELVAIFDPVFAGKTRDEWMEIFPAYGLMFSPVLRIEDVLCDDQALANGYVRSFEHPVYGEGKAAGFPVHFGRVRTIARKSAPALGEHTRHVLGDLGYTEREIDRLFAVKAVG